jgi:ATP-dependent helicase/nuclease subunit B
VRFLLGPAGSGKTFRCLAEVRAALAKEPDGAPLIILAPKQATFQLERQLLTDETLAGFTQLQILSFDRLAKFIFDQLNVAPPKLLSGEGRLMVLRALLHKHAGELKLFSGSAKRGGFAQELGGVLRELQEHQFGPAKLRTLAADEKLRRDLRDKLQDLALISEKYADWLREHGLQDANNLLDFATEALRGQFQVSSFKLQVSALWLDGFAEMTPQELALLTAFIPFCNEATLAFCLETEPTKTKHWLSIWSAIGKTFQNCRQQIAALPDCKTTTEVLKRETGKSRFTADSDLAILEETWTLQAAQLSASDFQPSTIHITACANPEAEAVHAARDILKFVRDGNNRFRDCAVLVRNLETHHQAIARVFRRYEIPFFLDRRESVAHHPLAELTRNALRTAAFDWKPDDWFAALKSGFAPATETAIDDLENRALEFGWRGKKWREPLPEENSERVRNLVLPPFEKLFRALQRLEFKPTGAELANLIHELWRELDVESVLQRWTDEENSAPSRTTHHASPHATVWEQMNSWLDNLAQAFPREPLALGDWLPILEAGLGNLTVGVIPPSLDEVLVGAIDRARNPDLKFAMLLGVNETVFPASPTTPVILTASDRDELEKRNVALGSNALDQISRERYLGYIACTRANEKLSLTYSRQNADGKTLNPSPFIAQVRRIFPGIAVEEFSADTDWREAQHAGELVPLLVKAESEISGLREIPSLNLLASNLATLREPDEKENLSPEFAAKIYGPVLKTSVSRLEEFAACPFKFFMRAGLRANERKVFELDARERGNFQHDVLKIFHEQLVAEGKRWRDLTPDEARTRIRTISDAQMELHRDGIFRESAATAFAARAMGAALQDFVEIIVGWMRSQYEFDPAAAELGFGGANDSLPVWEIKLSGGKKLALNGRIDRVDFWRDPDSDKLLAVVTDYKSSEKKLEPLRVENGLQLQLLAYLGALKSFPNASSLLPSDGQANAPIIPAGAFYVSLRGKFESGGERDAVLGNADAKRLAYRHSGRFDSSHLRKFDRRDVTEGDQFKFKVNKDGNLSSKLSDSLPCKEFAALLDQVEEQLRGLGEKIFSGAAAVDPYRKGQETPCERCDYRAACRIDEWTHEFRELRTKVTDETKDP